MNSMTFDLNYAEEKFSPKITNQVPCFWGYL